MAPRLHRSRTVRLPATLSSAVRLAAVALLLIATPAAARTLHWRSLEVEAALRSDGRLDVVERHLMVFTGDWNGGERTFRVLPGQELELHAVRRVDPESGENVDLRRGGLGRVDNYDWHDRRTLRWRSRLPSDAEFDRTAILYELDYSLSGVVQEHDGVYWLDHDFAFSDRAGVIEAFRLSLEIDDAWAALPIPAVERSPTANAERITLQRESLAPGEGVRLNFGLEREGSASPVSVLRRLPRSRRLAVIAFFLAGTALLVGRFLIHERKQGRYRAAKAPPAADPAWLESHLLSMSPEVVGAVWDHRIGPAEVAAVLARLVAEGRLASSVRSEGRWFKKQILELELLVERAELSGYERRLIDKLFFGGRTRTDTEAVRKRYRSSGFSPAASIRSGLRKEMRKLPGFSSKLKKPSRALSLKLVLGGVACLIFETVARGIETSGPVIALLLVSLLVCLLLGYGVASVYRRKADRLWLPLGVLFALMAVPLAILCWALATGGGSWMTALDRTGLAGTIAMALVPLGLFNSLLNAARTRDRKDAVGLRRQLVAVRRALARELRRRDPRLDDAWMPYLLALGLQGRVERWFKAFGGASGTRPRPTGSAISSAGSAGWTGGGGAFGGAGATASWAAAAGSLAAGVSKPSSGGSSGGSRGGGGGGSSSGGGGGGGW